MDQGHEVNSGNGVACLDDATSSSASSASLSSLPSQNVTEEEEEEEEKEEEEDSPGHVCHDTKRVSKFGTPRWTIWKRSCAIRESSAGNDDVIFQLTVTTGGEEGGGEQSENQTKK